MKTEHAEILNETFCKVVEQAAFMFAEPAEAVALPAAAGPCLAVEMEFFGGFSGGLRMAASSRFCVEMAANVLGMEPDDPESEAHGIDMLKELLNVVCGNVLTEIAGAEAIFTLSIPQAAPIDAESWRQMLGRGPACFAVDEHPVLVELVAEGAEQ